jgi:hypothetical protein
MGCDVERDSGQLIQIIAISQDSCTAGTYEAEAGSLGFSVFKFKHPNGAHYHVKSSISQPQTQKSSQYPLRKPRKGDRSDFYNFPNIRRSLARTENEQATETEDPSSTIAIRVVVMGVYTTSGWSHRGGKTISTTTLMFSGSSRGVM